MEALDSSFDPLNVVLLAVPAFVALWVGILYLISRIGGWHTLAQTYGIQNRGPSYSATPVLPIGKTAHFGSLALRGGLLPSSNYNSVVTYGINTQALQLSVLFPFRPGHETLYIPLSDLEGKEVNIFLGFRAVEVRVKSVAKPYLVMTRSRAKWIEDNAAGNWNFEKRA